MSLTGRRKLLLGFVIVLLAVFFLYPWKQVVVAPAIRVHILDEAGNPAPGTTVKQKWEYRVIGSKEYEQILKADENGYASFPQRVERISLAQLIPSIARELIHLPHGYGFGSLVVVYAYSEDPYLWDYVPFSWYETFPQEIQLKRHHETRYPYENMWP